MWVTNNMLIPAFRLQLFGDGPLEIHLIGFVSGVQTGRHIKMAAAICGGTGARFNSFFVSGDLAI